MVDIGELLDGEHNHTEDEMYKVIEFEQQLAEVQFWFFFNRNFSHYIWEPVAD